jgi:F0F1-type ATP synthase assembly protein I
MSLARLAAIVLTANHYLFDAVAGAIIALLGLLLAVLLSKRHKRHRARPTAESPPQT